MKKNIDVFVIGMLAGFSNITMALEKEVLNETISGVVKIGICKKFPNFGRLNSQQLEDFRLKFYPKATHKKYSYFVKAIDEGKKYCSSLKNADENIIFSFSGHGTGFLLNNEGYIATNDHVAGKELVVVYDGGTDKDHQRPAKRIWKSQGHDLTIIKVEKFADNRKPLSLVDPVAVGLTVSDKVWSLGFPGGSEYNLAKDFNIHGARGFNLQVVVDSGDVRLSPDTERFLQPNDVAVKTIEHSATINGGNSGGPLIDACGRVVGINQSKVVAKNVDNTFHSVSSAHLIDALKSNNIKFSLATDECIVNTGGVSAKFIIPFVIILLSSFMALIIWIKKHQKKNPVGMTEVVRRELSNYFRKDKKQIIEKTGATGKTVIKTKAPASASDTVNDIGYLVGRENLTGIALKLTGSGSVVLGRSGDADLVIHQEAVGRQHARISWDVNTGEVWLEDLESTNGTFLEDGSQLSARTKVALQPGSGFYLSERDNGFRLLPKRPSF